MTKDEKEALFKEFAKRLSVSVRTMNPGRMDRKLVVELYYEDENGKGEIVSEDWIYLEDGS